MYAPKMTSFERLTLIGTFLGTFVTFITLFFILIQVVGAIKESKIAQSEKVAETLRSKRESTLSYWANTLVERNDMSQEVSAHLSSISIQEIIAESDKNENLRLKISRLLGYYEMLSTGVNLDIYDLLTVKHLAGGKLVSTWHDYEPFINRRRDAMRNLKLYREFEILAKKLENFET